MNLIKIKMVPQCLFKSLKIIPGPYVFVCLCAYVREGEREREKEREREREISERMTSAALKVSFLWYKQLLTEKILF